MRPDACRRIVCLTEEPTEILYLLGEEHRIVGISAYTVRPPAARRDHPVVSAFISGSLDRICALEPDLVIGFSDIQAQLAHDLIKAGLQVAIFNQRRLDEILGVVLTIGRLVGAGDRAAALVDDLLGRLDRARQVGAARTHRPRVYFEEWPDPMISAIGWVSELIEVAGGIDCFAARASGKLARDRFVTAAEVVAARPEVMLASWCGKPFDRARVDARPGFAALPALRDDAVYEVDPSIILQPGPACILAGLPRLVELIHGGR